MQVSKSVATLVVVYLVYCLVRFLQSYSTARKIGLPICICPVNFHSLAWTIASVPLRPLFKSYLPQWLSFRLETVTYGAEFVLRDQVIQKYGSTVVICGIGSLALWSADAHLTTSMLQKHREFPLAKIAQDIMGMCGPNMASSSGEDWQRQRRIIAPMINERISAATWNESVNQAAAMVRNYSDFKDTGTNSSMNGFRTLAFNVLGDVAYGKPQAWTEPKAYKHQSASQATFLDVILCIADDLPIAALLPTGLLLSPVMPKFVQSIGRALRSFPRMADTLVAEERRRNSSSNNILSTIIRLIDAEKETSKLYLSREEIVGNLFQFTLAGYDTTANTLCYALLNLAIYPQWQDWIQEEIDRVSIDSQDYQGIFPQLTRIMALMFETLRLYTPVAHVVRRNTLPVTIKTENGTQHAVPPGMEFTLAFALTHINPQYWGKDALTFRPDRWIGEDGSLIEPTKGAFMPWSFGPRVCPGTKMAQVEFAAAFYIILRECKIEPVLEDHENLETAQKRLIAVMMDSSPLTTLQLNKPEQVKLKWLRRDHERKHMGV